MRPWRRDFVAEPAAISAVHDFIETTLEAKGVSETMRDDIVLACDEAASNIVEHALGVKRCHKGPKLYFAVSLKYKKNKVIATFFDAGEHFDVAKVKPPDVNQNLSGERRGGFGVFLMQRLVDKIVYSARRHFNVTRLEKEV